MSDDVVAKADREIAFYQSDPQAAAKLGWPVNLLSELRDEVLRLRDLSNHNFEAAMQLQTEIERLHTLGRPHVRPQ